MSEKLITLLDESNLRHLTQTAIYYAAKWAVPLLIGYTVISKLMGQYYHQKLSHAIEFEKAVGRIK